MKIRNSIIYLIFLPVIILFSSCNKKLTGVKTKNITTETDSLFKAVHNMDIKTLSKYLNNKNVNSFDSTGRTLLCRAIKTKNKNIVKILLDKGANPDLQNEKGYLNTPLMECSNYNLVDIAKLLIDKGANINIQDKNGDPVIHWTAYYGQVAFTKLLLDKNANTYTKSIHSNKGVMQVALKQYQDSIVDLLLQYKITLFKVEQKNIKIIDAAKNNNLHYLKLNITQSNINTRDQTAATLLIIASQRGYFDLVKFLIKNNADIDITNSVGQTALNLATYYGHYSVAIYLINNNANVNKADEKFILTPLIAASIKNRIKIGELLLKKGANINTGDGINNFTPLFWAAAYNNIDFVKLLLNYNPDISVISKYKTDVFKMTSDKEILKLLNDYKNQNN